MTAPSPRSTSRSGRERAEVAAPGHGAAHNNQGLAGLPQQACGHEGGLQRRPDKTALVVSQGAVISHVAPTKYPLWPNFQVRGGMGALPRLDSNQ